MKPTTTTRLKAAGVVFTLVVSAWLGLSGAGGCGGGGGSGASRGITGTLSASSLQSVRLKSATQALTLKRQAVACGDVSVCCGGYDGTLLVTEVGSDCTFTLDLPLENFCYCALFTGDDADDNECPDDYIASLGCSENGYGGAIPIFADADDTTDAIDLGTGDVQGSNVVATGNPCAQVDQDDDGTADSDDTDDDEDGTADAGDFQNAIGCINADRFDSDGDEVPDIYEGLWSSEIQALKVRGPKSQLDTFFEDSDDDDVPDFCDADFACEPDEDDNDGDCIPDEFDGCDDDEDADGVPFCVDCDDADSASTVECYADDFCDIDSDQDGYGLCDDCDDWDSDSTYECFGDDFCADDADADGFGFCLDCDDEDATSTTECYDDFIDDFCEEDNDNDGFGICVDCDDFESGTTTECYGTLACAEDFDSDGVDFCSDCDDFDPTVTMTFADGCPVAAGGCSITDCSVDFECQQFAENQLGDGDTSNDVCPNEGVSCMTCVSGCCEITQ